MREAEEKSRIFIATFFEEEAETIVDALSGLSEETQKVLKKVPKINIHLTWKFIGEVDVSKQQIISDIVEEHSNLLKGCYLYFDKIAVWPNKRTPRQIVITATEVCSGVNVFYTKIEEDLLQRAEIPKETRAFNTHITLARFRKDCRRTPEDCKQIEWKLLKTPIRHVKVVKSTLTKTGSLFETVYASEL